jgi:hypothetical protein
VGHLIESGLLSHELVRRHLVKPLIVHFYFDHNNARNSGEAVRANAIYSLFIAAGGTLLQGLLKPEDVQVCFEILETRISLGEIEGLETLRAAKLNVRCDSCLDASQ